MSESAASTALPAEAVIAVVGAGTMGAGIAQIAALAGHPVRLHDSRDGAAAAAIAGIGQQFAKLVERGKLARADAEAAQARLQPAAALAELADAALVIEAIIENLDAKQALFAALEAGVAADAILATNTSSISVTAIAARLARPERLVGMHFFNPVPLMALVEVISGAATAPEAAATVFATAAAWGKSPVHARSTPGFIVNRVARPFYAEGLRLLQEGAASAATLDAVMRDCGGFRMGPFELMDLIGHDVNYAVTRSVFEAFHGDPRFMPSPVQLELVEAGRLGRKSGRGFHDYRAGAEPPRAEDAAPQPPPAAVTLNLATVAGAALAVRLADAAGLAVTPVQAAGEDWIARTGEAVLHASDGRSATRRAAESGVAATLVLDLMLDPARAPRAAIAAALQCPAAARQAVIGLLQAAGHAVSVLRDAPGLAVTRTVAMLANEACDAVHQQVCAAPAVDLAMRAGVGYPRGPLAWADALGPAQVLRVIEHLHAHYGDPRYRASPRLRQTVWAARRLLDELPE